MCFNFHARWCVAYGLVPMSMGPGLFFDVFFIVWGVHVCSTRLTAMGLGVCFGLLVVSLQSEGPRLDGTVVIQGRVVSTPVGTRADVAVVRWRRMGAEWVPASGRVRVRFCEGPPTLGQTVSILGRARPLNHTVLPWAPNPYLVSALSRVKTEVNCRMSSKDTQRSAPEPSLRSQYSGVMVALATGDRSGVTQDMWQTLRNTGTSHLLAISGFHIGLIAWSAYAVARRLSHCVALWCPSGMNDRLLLLVPIVASWMYAIGAGLPVSALRATIMVSILVLAKMMNRTVCPLDMVGLAAVLVLSIEPVHWAHRISIVLYGCHWLDSNDTAAHGFGADAEWGLDMAMGGIEAGECVIVDVSWPRGGFRRSLGCSVGECICAPLGSLDCGSPVIWCGMVAGPYGVYVPILADYALELFVGLEQISYAPLIIANADRVPLGNPTVYPTKALSVVGLAAQLSCGTQSDALILTMLDVGHGESVLVTWPTREHWLIDGAARKRCVAVPWSAGIESLTLWWSPMDIATTWVGWPVLRPFSHVWLGGSWDDRVVQIAARRGIPITMNPTGTFSADASSANEQSLVLPIHWGGFSVLLTGDIGTDTEPQLMREYRSPIDILKVPHHGSRYSSSESFLEGLAPRIALISASGAYGLPHRDTLERHRARDICFGRIRWALSNHIRPEGITGWSYRGDRGGETFYRRALDPVNDVRRSICKRVYSA